MKNTNPFNSHGDNSDPIIPLLKLLWDTIEELRSTQEEERAVREQTYADLLADAKSIKKSAQWLRLFRVKLVLACILGGFLLGALAGTAGAFYWMNSTFDLQTLKRTAGVTMTVEETFLDVRIVLSGGQFRKGGNLTQESGSKAIYLDFERRENE